MIKWKGQNTFRNITWTETAETFEKLYYKLIDNGVISTEDGFPDEIYKLDKVGLKLSDFDEVEEDWNYEFQNWLEAMTKGIELTEDDYMMIIKSEKGNAYYQEFEETE